jgi:hypothetical protein
VFCDRRCACSILSAIDAPRRGSVHAFAFCEFRAVPSLSERLGSNRLIGASAFEATVRNHLNQNLLSGNQPRTRLPFNSCYRRAPSDTVILSLP